MKSDAKAVCSKTGRPALRAGEGIVLKAAQVIPKQIKRYQNPFGDGKFKLTVTNTSQVAADVPALLADGGRISWAGSLLIFSRGTVHFLPGAGALGDPRPVRLEPGESVSAVIDVLPVSGIRWPRGGSRVIFTFCLGELTARNFFYYFSRRHDRLRREAIQKLEPGG